MELLQRYLPLVDDPDAFLAAHEVPLPRVKSRRELMEIFHGTRIQHRHVRPRDCIYVFEEFDKMGKVVCADASGNSDGNAGDSGDTSGRVAGAGPMPMMRGATPAVAMPTIRALGVRPFFAAVAMPFVPDLLAGQRAGAVLAWVVSDLAMIAAAAAQVRAWSSTDVDPQPGKGVFA